MGKPPNKFSTSFGENLSGYAKQNHSINGFGKAFSKAVIDHKDLFGPFISKVSPAALDRWCKGYLPNEAFFTALAIFILYQNDLDNLQHQDINFGRVTEFKGDLEKLSHKEFVAKYQIVAHGDRSFIYALYSEYVRSQNHKGAGSPIGLVGVFKMSGESERQIEGKVYHVFLNSPRRHRGDWVSSHINEQQIAIDFDFHIERKEHPVSQYDVGGNVGHLSMRAVDEATVVGRRGFTGRYVDYDPQGPERVGSFYGEEIDPGAVAGVTADLDGYAQQLIKRAVANFEAHPRIFVRKKAADSPQKSGKKRLVARKKRQ